MSLKKYIVVLDDKAVDDNGIMQTAIYDFFSREEAENFLYNLADVSEFDTAKIMEETLSENDYKIHLFAHWCLIFLGLPDIHLDIDEVIDLDGSCLCHPEGTPNGYALHIKDMRFNLANIFSIAHQMRFVWLNEVCVNRGIDITDPTNWEDSFNIDMYAFASYVIEFFFGASNMEQCFIGEDIALCDKVKNYVDLCSEKWANKIGYAITNNNYTSELGFESFREQVIDSIKRNEDIDPNKIFAKKLNKEQLN